MTFNNKQELIDKIKEKQESAKNALEALKVEQCWTIKDGQNNILAKERNKAYMEAYEDVIALIDSAKIVPERNDELDARQYAVEGLNKNQNLLKAYFGATIKVNTKKRIVGSTTPFESTGKVVSDSGKYVSIKQEDGGNVIIDKEDIENIEIMTAPEYKETLFADPLKVSNKGCVEENDQKTLFEKEPKQNVKVKIMKSAYYSEFENDITDFIKDKNIIDIKFAAGSDYGMLNYCAMIIYKEEVSESEA